MRYGTLVHMATENHIQMLTITRAAEVYGVHPQTIRTWLRQGAPHMQVGRVVRIDPDELRVWTQAKNRKVASARANKVLSALATASCEALDGDDMDFLRTMVRKYDERV
jgi:excisionase family DNA binding protein